MKLPSLASIGQNIQFVAFMAHFGCSYALVATFHYWPVPLSVIVLSAIKEFWYDAKYETDPPQTALDGWEDFAGYAIGVIAAWFIL